MVQGSSSTVQTRWEELHQSAKTVSHFSFLLPLLVSVYSPFIASLCFPRYVVTISEKTPQAVAPPRRMCSVRAPSSPRNPAPAGQAIRSVPAYACSVCYHPVCLVRFSFSSQVVPEAVVTKECEPFVPEERPKQPFDNRDVDTGVPGRFLEVVLLFLNLYTGRTSYPLRWKMSLKNAKMW